MSPPPPPSAPRVRSPAPRANTAQDQRTIAGFAALRPPKVALACTLRTDFIRRPAESMAAEMGMDDRGKGAC